MVVRLTQHAVAAAIAAGAKAEIRDAQARGLLLRVWGPGKWAWNIRRTYARRDYRLDLGNDWTLEQAREIANAAAADLRSRRGLLVLEPEAWQVFIGIRRAQRDGVPYKPTPQPAPPSPYGTDWRDAQAEWIVDVARTRRETTAADYNACLKVRELRVFHDRMISMIRREEIAEALTAISKRGAERQAEASTIAVRRFFAWLGSDAHRRKFGVTTGLLAGLRAPERSLKEDEEDDSEALYVPTGDDVARIVEWLRNTVAAPERDRLAGLLLVYTVQRRRAVALARKADFEPAGVFGGLWNLPALHRKKAAQRRRQGLNLGAHVVPLPPAAWAIVEQAMKVAGDSAYLFPAMRDRRSGKPALTMHPSNLTHLFGAIEGNKATPHDMRRAFGTTYARSARLKLSDVKQILDHAEGVAPGDVTATHYSFLDGTHEKWPLMRGWSAWIDEQVVSPGVV